MQIERQPLTLIDAHGHFYSCFDANAFLEAANANFDRAAEGLEVAPHQPRRLLLLADPSGSDSFGLLTSELESTPSVWSLEETREQDAVEASRSGVTPITLIRGRQVVAEERIEILSFGPSGELDDGLPFEILVRRAVDAGGITILPWGFGKWLGSRAKLVRRTITETTSGTLFTGDSGARLARTPTPSIIADAVSDGIWNLPGSDPLPFAGQEQRVATRGAMISARVDRKRPRASLTRHLRAMSAQPRIFGRGLGPYTFFKLHGLLQLGRSDERVPPRSTGGAT